MAISDARVVRHVRCPKCFSVLQEPSGAPVYQCGGCGTNLRAKNRTGNSQELISAPSSLGSGLPPQSKHLGSSDVASTSGSTPEAPITGRQQGGDMTSRRETDDLMSARNSAPEQVVPAEEEEHVQSSSQQAVGNSEDFRRGDDAGSAQCRASVPDGKAQLLEGRNGQTEPDAAAKKSSEETSQPWRRDVVELPVPSSAQTADSQPAPAMSKREDDTAADAAERKTTNPPHSHARQPSESLAPLQKRILKTVDNLKDDLSELFRKSPELKPRTHARPPRLPRQEGYPPRDAAMAATNLAAIRARHAAVHRPGYIARAGKPGQLAAPPPRGLPSRRYRRCRADRPCCPDAHHGPSCHHGCCHHYSKQACTSCRGQHCCRPRTQEPPAPRKPPAAKDVKRRAPPRNHCRPVLKGAPFIICSSCFKLVQVPTDFAVSTKTVRKLLCGSCSAVLCYSYRDPDRKKHGDQYSTDGSQAAPRHARRDPFAFMDDFFGHVDVSYSTEDEQPLHVSRNSSFNTVDEVPNATAQQQQQSSSLHRLMGYGSASDLLFRQHSPDLYESFSERTTPEAAALYDRKGKSVCVDFDGDGDDDSDEDCSGALKRSRVRGSGWPLPGILNKGMPGMGAIRIKS